VISLAKKEELIFTQAQSEPIRLARNNLGLKLLQYARDEAHRFAQHYHHILRRKAQLEEGVKQGRRPPPRSRTPRKPRKAATESSEQAWPLSTLASLPVLKPPTTEPPPVSSNEAMDTDDFAPETPEPMTRDEAMAAGVQPTHVLPPKESEANG
jgi:hypothetical protein